MNPTQVIGTSSGAGKFSRDQECRRVGVDGHYIGDPAGITAELLAEAMGQTAGTEDSLQV